MAKEDETAADGAAGSGSVVKLKDLLSQAGYPMPDAANDIDTLCIALEAAIMAKNPPAAEPELDTDNDGIDNESDATPGGQTSSVSPAMLSALPTEHRGAVEAGYNALALVTTNTRAGLLARFAKVEKPAAEHGLYTPTQLQSLKQRLSTVALSFLPATGALKMNNATHELALLENAVRGVLKAKGGKPAAGTPKTRSVNLSGFGGPGVLDEAEQAKAIADAAEAAANRVSPRRAEVVIQK